MKKEVIKFPKDEWKDIKERLDDGKFVFSIRVSNDYNKFKKDKVYLTEWGYKVIIVDSRKINSIENYEYKNEIPIEQLKYLKQFNKVDVIKLKSLK